MLLKDKLVISFNLITIITKIEQFCKDDRLKMLDQMPQASIIWVPCQA